ncbi:hypothetical protein AB0C28_56075 [Nonomuraea sp. NPDC048892]|uniref:NACHT domain-containing protein n=1 Tax=Nonomuraea sp. NPDC048892 TaxID=3154624 RepID=UPI0033F3E110
MLLGLVLMWMAANFNLKALDIPSFLSTAGGVVALTDGVLRLLFQWRRARRPSPAASPDEIRKAKDILALQVTEQCKDAMRVLMLDDPRPIPVFWRSAQRDELRGHPRLNAGQKVVFSSSDHIARLADAFRGLKRKRLVIIGDQGSGKTTLALQLLAELTETRRPEDPVPVLLPAASWPVRTGEHDDTAEYVPLHEWLAEYLDMEYPALRAEGLAPNLPRELASHGEVLPVLDALDEAPDEAAMLRALKRSLYNADQLIVTCRTSEFLEAIKSAWDVLTTAAVLEPDRLSPTSVADYLAKSLPRRPTAPWPDILAKLRGGTAPALAEVTSKPLGLWLIREVYVADKKEATKLQRLGEMADPQALRTHLCDQLIPTLIKLHPRGNKLFSPLHTLNARQVRDWLAYLSLHPSPDGSPHDVAWWSLTCNPHSRLVPWVVSTLCGLVVGVTLGLLESPATGLAIGVACGILVRLKVKSWFTEWPGFANLNIWERLSVLGKTTREALCMALMGAMVGFLQSKGRVDGAITLGLVSGLGYEFTMGLPRWVEKATEKSTARSPRSTWKDDRHLTLIRIISGVVIGLLASLIGWRHGMSVATALTGGILLGMIFGLVQGRHHAWLAYYLTIPRLATRRRLPLRTMSFLEDAYRVGLLRMEGPYYQFRDTLLQEHLAEHHIERFGSCHPHTRKREEHLS